MSEIKEYCQAKIKAIDKIEKTISDKSNNINKDNNRNKDNNAISNSKTYIDKA